MYAVRRNLYTVYWTFCAAVFQWEAFSLPELENFLKILNREEQEYAEQVKLKYRLLRLQMQQHSKELIPSPAGESGEGEDASSSISQTVEQDNRTPVFVWDATTTRVMIMMMTTPALIKHYYLRTDHKSSCSPEMSGLLHSTSLEK